MEMVVELVRASREPLEHVGGKARNLGRLLAGGFRVPDGYCVTSDACVRFLEYNGIDPAVATEEAVARGSFPSDVEHAIRSASESLLGPGARPVAVRSSGASEDGSAFAFAGQFETYLNLTDVASVLEHVRMCWASAWNYRLRTYAPDLIPRIAVVIQEMVEAEKSGILFTRNPVASGAPGIFVEANWGLGETVVGGEVSPDSYVLDRNTGRVAEKQIARKLWRLRPGDRRAEPMPEGLRDAEALSSDELRILWRQGRKIEAFSDGRPQDVEWAFSGGRLFLLQTRPITTTVSRPARRVDAGDLRRSLVRGPLSDGRVRHWGAPERGLYVSTSRAALGLSALIRDDVMKVIDCYMYVNADAVADALKLVPESLMVDDALDILPRRLREEVKGSTWTWWRIGSGAPAAAGPADHRALRSDSQQSPEGQAGISPGIQPADSCYRATDLLGAGSGRASCGRKQADRIGNASAAGRQPVELHICDELRLGPANDGGPLVGPRHVYFEGSASGTRKKQDFGGKRRSGEIDRGGTKRHRAASDAGSRYGRGVPETPARRRRRLCVQLQLIYRCVRNSRPKPGFYVCTLAGTPGDRRTDAAPEPLRGSFTWTERGA